MKSKLKKSPKSGSKIFTLQSYLEKKFGKENAAVVEWKWTPEQLEQLEKEKQKKPKKSCLK